MKKGRSLSYTYTTIIREERRVQISRPAKSRLTVILRDDIIHTRSRHADRKSNSETLTTCGYNNCEYSHSTEMTAVAWSCPMLLETLQMYVLLWLRVTAAMMSLE